MENEIYESFVNELENSFKEFIDAAREGQKKKVAALKARKLSITLRNNLKEFRQKSIEHDLIKKLSKK